MPKKWAISATRRRMASWETAKFSRLKANGACRFFDAQSGGIFPEDFDRARVNPVGGKLWLAAAQQRGFAAACGAGDQRKRSFFDFRAKGPDKGAPVLVRLCGEAFC